MSSLAVALTGNPNTGKSTIFNELTGARQKIGNWPGVTVDKKIGYLSHQGRNISVVDLPGTYSVNARSPEEKIVIDYLLNEKPDLVVDVLDSSNLERNLYLTIQLLEQGIPLLLDLNMQDEAKRHGIRVDTEKLGAALGMPVVETTARSRSSIKTLLDVFTSTMMEKYQPSEKVRAHIARVEGLRAGNLAADALEEKIIEERYAFIDSVVSECVSVAGASSDLTEKIDAVLANGWTALPLFLVMLYAVFQITFEWIGQPMADALDDFIGGPLTETVTETLESWEVADWMQSLIEIGRAHV